MYHFITIGTGLKLVGKHSLCRTQYTVMSWIRPRSCHQDNGKSTVIIGEYYVYKKYKL
jgi:hypothetical protein